MLNLTGRAAEVWGSPRAKTDTYKLTSKAKDQITFWEGNSRESPNAKEKPKTWGKIR